MRSLSISWRTSLGAAAVIFLLVGCQGAETSLGSDLRNIEIKATVSASRALTLPAPADGVIIAIDVREGDTVAQGQQLASISNPNVERDYVYARAQVSVAESRLRESGRGVTGTRYGESLSRERAAALVLENKKTKLERYRALRRTQDVTAQELEDAENEHAWAVRDYLNERGSGGAVASSDRTGLYAELEKAQAEESLARERRSSLKIKAPISGAITGIKVIKGQTVYTRDSLFDIADISRVEVRGEISSDLIRQVRPGMPIEVKVFTVPTRTMQTKIDHVVPMQSGGAASVVVVVLPNRDNLLRPNTPARMTVRF